MPILVQRDGVFKLVTNPYSRTCASHLSDRVVFMRLRSICTGDGVRQREVVQAAWMSVTRDSMLDVLSACLS
jgi:hypothetical protein